MVEREAALALDNHPAGTRLAPGWHRAGTRLARRSATGHWLHGGVPGDFRGPLPGLSTRGSVPGLGP
jgi:hypothetical protein